MPETPELTDPIYVIIPMLNEQNSIASVLQDLPPVTGVIVVDNGSTDNGPAIAEQAGAKIIREPQRGYGKACLTGIEHVKSVAQNPSRTIVAFIDGDYSDHGEQLPQFISAIRDEGFDFVIGSRTMGNREKGAMHPQAIFGNWLACTLMRIFWGVKYSDLGPFRAIRFQKLLDLGMQDESFGWTIEMQIKACQHKLKTKEIPTDYRCRVGVSKISGTVTGTFRAGYTILYTIFRYRFF